MQAARASQLSRVPQSASTHPQKLIVATACRCSAPLVAGSPLASIESRHEFAPESSLLRAHHRCLDHMRPLATHEGHICRFAAHCVNCTLPCDVCICIVLQQEEQQARLQGGMLDLHRFDCLRRGCSLAVQRNQDIMCAFELLAPQWQCCVCDSFMVLAAMVHLGCTGQRMAVTDRARAAV